MHRCQEAEKCPCHIIKGQLWHFAELLGVAYWNCGVAFLIGNLTTLIHGIKTAKVDN